MPSWLSGSKTYVVAVVGALVTVVYMLDWMRQDTWLGVMAFLVSAGTATQRAAVAKIETQVDLAHIVARVQAADVDAHLARIEQKVAQGPSVVVVDATPAPSHIIVP